MPSTALSNSLNSSQSDRKTSDTNHARDFVNRVFGADMHALRVLSVADGVLGVLHTAMLSIHAIGQAYALVAKITAKSGVKQVDRLLSNGGIALEVVLQQWARFIVGQNAEIIMFGEK